MFTCATNYDFFFFFSSRRRHTRYWRDWSSDVCSSDLQGAGGGLLVLAGQVHPEQHASPLGVAQALGAFLGADSLGMPGATPCPQRQQRALGESRPLDGAARAGAVAGAGRPLQDVPQVV